MPVFAFEPKATLGNCTGARHSGFRKRGQGYGFAVRILRGLGARLERALINFMMDLHSDQHGYEEILPPYIVNRDSLVGTGQLPSLKRICSSWRIRIIILIPTAEVPVTNFHREEILSAEELPKYFVAYSACFRSEAGSAGRDTRGLDPPASIQ